MIRLALFGAGTALLSWLLEIFGEHEINIAVEAALLLLALTLLAAYWHHARQTPYPLLQLALFKVRTFRVSVIGGFQQIQHFSRLSPTSLPRSLWPKRRSALSWRCPYRKLDPTGV